MISKHDPFTVVRNKVQTSPRLSSVFETKARDREIKGVTSKFTKLNNNAHFDICISNMKLQHHHPSPQIKNLEFPETKRF